MNPPGTCRRGGDVVRCTRCRTPRYCRYYREPPGFLPTDPAQQVAEEALERLARGPSTTFEHHVRDVWERIWDLRRIADSALLRNMILLELDGLERSFEAVLAASRPKR